METVSDAPSEGFTGPYPIRVFPNPSDGFLQLGYDEPLSNSMLEIRDLTGRVVVRETGQVQRLDVSHLAHGLYMMVMGNGEMRWVQKLVIGR